MSVKPQKRVGSIRRSQEENESSMILANVFVPIYGTQKSRNIRAASEYSDLV